MDLESSFAATALRAQELKIDFLHQQRKKVDAIEGILGQTGSSWSKFVIWATMLLIWCIGERASPGCS